MKIFKKTLSVFLAVLMLASALSVSLVAFAANSETDAAYKELAYSFFNYIVVPQGATTKYEISTDSNGYPQRSLVGDMEQYEIVNESGDYQYADSDDSPIRAISYTHTVNAKDDSQGHIRNAAEAYLAIVDNIISYKYDEGNYTVPMLIDAVTNELKFYKVDGEYLFLDGYTYLTNARGELVGRSEEKTYEVVGNEIKYFAESQGTSWRDAMQGGATIRDLIAAGSVNEITLFDYCNVSSVIDYFSGNCTTVNSGNWFHQFVFNCDTDLETVLVKEAFSNADYVERHYSVTWTMNRQFDDSGTKAQYYNNGYAVTSDTEAMNSTRATLGTLQGYMNNYFDKYYAEGVLAGTTNEQIINSCYNEIRADYDTFSSLSNEAMVAVFGQSAYSYMNLVTQLTPISNPGGEFDKYTPVHTYSKYTDASGNKVEYKVTTERMTSVVSTIDAIMMPTADLCASVGINYDNLKNSPADREKLAGTVAGRVGSILQTFFNFNDPKYEGKVFYGEPVYTTHDVLYRVIQNYVFDDSIINMLLGLLYPMVTNLLDQYLTGDMISGMLKSAGVGGLEDLIEYIVECDDSWEGLIYGALISVGVGLTPAGVAYVWNKYGYMSTSDDTSFNSVMQANHDKLKAAEGGTLDESTSGWYKSKGYYSIGVEKDKYYGDRWGLVDFDSLYWGINGDRDKFQSALCAILAPLAPLLGVLLGNQECNLKVGQLFLIDLRVILKDFDLYDDLLLPLLEALGIPNLCSSANFRNLANVINSDSTRNKTTIENFLNEGLLNPILNWVVDVVMADPISTILELLPNLSYYLTSGALLSTIKKIKIPITIQYAITLDNIIELSLKDLGIKDETLAFLDSIQGILDLIGISVDTGVPIVGYTEEGGDRVYRPGMSGYNEKTMTVGVTEAYKNVNGDMMTWNDGVEYTTLVKGTDENGELNSNAIYDQVGWANAAGNVVLELNDTTAKPEEYTTKVYKYYEYTVTDAETGESLTYRKTTPPTDGTEYKTVTDARTATEKAKLPAIMDYKLQACGTLTTTTTSLREDALTMTNKEGVQETWAAKTRKYIELKIDGNDTDGLVLLFLFRYLFSALEYRAYDEDTQAFTSDYTLIDAFGLRDMLSKELIAGLKLEDIIANIALHPDEAIAALYELFQKNESGSLLQVLGTAGSQTVSRGSRYTYNMEYPNYHTDDIMGNAKAHNDYNYGTSVLYTEYWSKDDSIYVIDNLDGIVDNVLAMLKMTDSDSLGDILGGLLDQYLFNNDLLSNLVGMLYGLLDSINGVDLATILDAALDVDYSKQFLYDAMMYEFDGIETEVAHKLGQDANNLVKEYTSDYFYETDVDHDTGEDVTRALDWGFNNEAVKAKYSSAEIFMRAASAALSPFAILIKYLFAGEDLSILGIVNIPGYDAYHYAWIPFMEALGASDGLINYNTFFTKLFVGDNTVQQNCDAFYYVLVPIFNFIDTLLANPIEELLGMLPNLLFFLSIGGLNGVVNNFLHFAYVLLDILQPVYDVYPLLNSLLSNIRIGSFTLNISVPLDLDINQLVNDLIGGLLGDLLTFDIENKNIILGYKDVEEKVATPILDENGEKQYDEEGNVIADITTEIVSKPVYAVGTLKITLPYIDLATLCAGVVEERTSISGERIVYLNSSGGADLLTLALRLVTQTLFYKDNAINVGNFLVGFCQLDDEYDNDDLLLEIFTYLNDQAQANELPDKTMKLIFTVYKVLVPIADGLGQRFANVDFSIIDMFSDMDHIGDYVSQLLNAGSGSGSDSKLSGFGRLIQLIKEFFAKLKLFFQKLFGKA